MVTVQGPDSRREEQLERMMALYEKDLLRVCTMYLRDFQLAEDAVQECFLRAYRHLGDFRGDSSEKTWLMHIALNICRDMRRGAWWRYIDRRVSLEKLPLPTAPPSVEHIALTTEILRLPRKYMEAVLLYYDQGFSVKEMAELLGISQPAVSSRLRRAREKLYDALEGEAYAGLDQ